MGSQCRAAGGWGHNVGLQVGGVIKWGLQVGGPNVGLQVGGVIM